ncbi:MAG: inorganic phosphate transporter, partial [Candidatus Obscuribacterales bacterium]|nr:inorganic phosphate transporter [Candidatus Obscuribacterales bacterium]
VLASGLTAAIVWNFTMRRFGVPSSSTHAFVGGIIGAVIAGCGSTTYLIFGSPGMLYNSTGIWKVLLSLFLSPVVGFLLSFLALLICSKLLVNASSSLNEPLKRMQWLAVPLLAFGHGANDTQKVMGIIVLAICAAGYDAGGDIPFWVRLSTASAMSAGVATLAPGIVKRVSSIYRQRPLHGLVTESTSALIVCFASLTGGPLAASQVIASTVIGAGTAERLKGVHWNATRDMIRTWLLTIPCSALSAWLLYELIFVHLNKLL